MHKTLVSDELWKIIEPHLPPDPSREKGGRPRIPNRNAFAGIVYVLKSSVPWRMLPKEVGGGSGTTCWRRLRDWQKAGVWWRLHRILLDHLGRADLIDWSRASLDSASIPAKTRKAPVSCCTSTSIRGGSAPSAGAASTSTRTEPGPIHLASDKRSSRKLKRHKGKKRAGA
jgi:transposase